ncbi:uncharacterized protein LOC116850740 [Odontomachus brunneus]|uniref:uncharacterized protein LOC116850740 n=1 Tax=Odontomachus brunneus TaxID=486640 RepID=UPI0013F25FAD|nr:uncharacterized protein LOC116850740 [Odontomachus brunneus]
MYLSLDIVNIFDVSHTEDKYNQFFNPNVCHVCKRPSSNLISCNQCYMISYCSEEHQEIHKHSHLEICTAIATLITDESFWIACSNSEEWIKSRKTILLKQVNIKPCNICYSANFCDDHQELFNLKHKDYCNELLLFLVMKIADINGIMERIMCPTIKFIKFPGAKPYDDIVTFIYNYMPTRNSFEIAVKSKFPNSTCHWRLNHFIYSDYVSGPLTLYYALQESNLLSLPSISDKYIVHFIDAGRIDIMYLRSWHIFLHFFKNIKELYIVFIKSPKFESEDRVHTCSTCFYKKQKLYVKYVSEPYHDYVRLESFEQPNVIVLLETESILVGTWFKSITTIIAQECPLLLTTDSECTAQENVDKIQEETGATRNRLYRKNKFRGYVPYRNYETGGFYYRNEHFIMYS